jgi:hypothetical protein
MRRRDDDAHPARVEQPAGARCRRRTGRTLRSPRSSRAPR